MADSTRTEITVRFATLLKVAAAIAVAALLYELRDIGALLVVSIILAILISPVADFCERHRLPRSLGVGVVYIVLVGFFGVVFTLVAQPIIIELRGLASALPAAWERIVPIAETLRAFSVEHGFSEQLRAFASGLEASVTAGIFGAVTGTFGGALSFLLVLVLTFYLSTYATTVRRSLVTVAPAHLQPFLIGVVPRIERKIGAWLRGILALAALMGLLAFIGLSVLRVEYALVLAVLTAVAEIVPYVGPITAAVLAVALTFVQSPVKALFVLIFYIVIQQLENHLLVPKVMQRMVGVHPIVSLIALLVGAKLAGIPGALLAIPIVTAITVFSEEYARERRNRTAVRSGAS